MPLCQQGGYNTLGNNNMQGGSYPNSGTPNGGRYQQVSE
jgi:hypothetical protein